MKKYDETETNGKRNSEDAIGRLGVIERKSGKYGINSNEVLDSNSPRRNSDRPKNSNTEPSSVGGIFRQLKELREFHLAQSEANEEELKKRLSNNEVYKKQVLQGIEEIEIRLKELGLSDEPS